MALSIAGWAALIMLKHGHGTLQSVLMGPQTPGLMVSAMIWGMHGGGGNWFDVAMIMVNAVVYTGVIMAVAGFIVSRRRHSV